MTGGPRSASDFHVAGLRLLGERGRDGLTIAALCKRLRVTKGSFYHHFGSMPAFVDQLFVFWETDQATRLAALPRAEGHPGERLEFLVDAALELPHDVEAAIRAWGGIDPNIAVVQARVDRRRERRVADTLVGLGLDREHARKLARLAVNTLIGAQLRDEAADWRRMRNLLDELARLMLRDIPRARAARRR
ncbi:TetR/AcrR family transcriptional regulator [uncultured Jatrophihabitans sp.]|uniref:TetR/AcrR family transcriptional regulator n=1 Tax=uncultured Jatrophihabitans sp. TaxID=1610747 RepID=UPI0035C97B6A